MSGPETQSPNRPPEESPSGAADPLLGSGSFINPERADIGGGSEGGQRVVFPRGVAIAAQPITMFIPSDDSMGEPSAPRSARRRNPEEMAKRPDWLPDGWRIDLKVRSSGASAGLIDRYYVEPSEQRKFRSKNEVLYFLETGDKLKRKDNAVPSASPPGQKQKKSRKSNSVDSSAMSDTKRKSSERGDSDATSKKSNAPDSGNSHPTDTPRET
ncbi:methyl-CpG-binding domain-containing protein 6-like [Andrographis paniculata]|uniref:methyl-CpG-binding domain-containing protein 6-like n=1 Tax=Andrographis paniculata TaxID=175694 RepID=UPI0021E9109D|nr:methyl-CpG-binding domain-containing protein 6-like [Andrographis paniculata]